MYGRRLNTLNLPLLLLALPPEPEPPRSAPEPVRLLREIGPSQLLRELGARLSELPQPELLRLPEAPLTGAGVGDDAQVPAVEALRREADLALLRRPEEELPLLVLRPCPVVPPAWVEPSPVDNGKHRGKRRRRWPHVPAGPSEKSQRQRRRDARRGGRP